MRARWAYKQEKEPAMTIATKVKDLMMRRPLPDMYFEAGDHRTLVHMSGPAFAELMHNARPLRHYIH